MKKPVALTLYDKMGSKAQLLPEQLLHIMQSTPKEHIYTRPAKGGGTWDYVTGVYVEKVLNYVFGWDWDFEIKEHGVEGVTVWVLGRLTVRTADGRQIVKEQFGRAELKKRKDGTGYLDYGNDLKAAATDAEKKCASKLGIASDVYGKMEFKEIKYEELKDLPNPKETIVESIVVEPKERVVIESKLDIAKLREANK
jgi:hypothetical protein